MDTFNLFNIIEGIFWVCLGGAMLYAVSKHSEIFKKYGKINLFGGINFIAFGASDWMEVYQGPFLDIWWLFAWKIINVCGIIAVLAGYYRKTKAFEKNDRSSL